MMDELSIIKELNRDARAWGRESAQRMKMLAHSSGRKRKSGEKGLAEGLRLVNKYRDGQIEAIGFQFKRSGVFLEMGVFGGLTREEAIARGKLNPKPWFNPVLKDQMTKLVDILEQHYTDMVEVNFDRLAIKNT